MSDHHSDHQTHQNRNEDGSYGIFIYGILVVALIVFWCIGGTSS